MSPLLTRDVSIIIPVFGAAENLCICLQSLSLHAPVDCHIFVLDDGTPDNSISECCSRSALANLTYVRSQSNRGFVTTCNWGWKDVAPKNNDILLLNSDTEVTSGFLQEMLRVLYLHERHGVVCPRSNNATIFSIPPEGPSIPSTIAYHTWKQINPDLPDYTVMPTAVGFCMLIKSIILERFGLFDEIYSPGYNEENDFVCRINRYGFSAVAANHAFVFHYESSTFGARRKELERKHREILLSRFPEYERNVSEYFQYSIDPVERFSILVGRRRPTILYDLFHLLPIHCGTSEFALNLLREIKNVIEDDYDLFVGLGENGRFFSPELSGYTFFENRPSSDMLFDLVFKPCQIFTWSDFRRMNRLAPRLTFVLQDIIGVRCSYLSSMHRQTIFSKTIELADKVFTISSYTHSDFRAFFGLDFSAQVIYHGSNLGLTASESLPGEHILLMGNSYAHKAVKDALPHLVDFGPIVVLGGDPPSQQLPSHVKWYSSGSLTRNHLRELFAKARVLVYPSHYEGYGLPIVDALALGKKVIALDTEVNQELKSCFNDADFVLIRTLRELTSAIPTIFNTTNEIQPQRMVRRWRHAAEEYVTTFRELLKQSPNVEKLRGRHELFRMLDSSQHP